MDMRKYFLIITILLYLSSFGQNPMMRKLIAKKTSLAPVPFSPKDSSGLLLWVKADALTLSDNDPISTWPDSSGNANNLTNTLLLRPTFKTNQQNSLPGILFTSSNTQYFNITNPIPSTLPYSLFIVYKKTTTGVLGLMLNGVAGNQYNWTDYSDDNLYIYPNNFSYNTGTAGYTTFTTASSIVSAAGIATVWINGISHSMSVGGGTGDTGPWIYLGANNAYGFADMTLLELVLFDHAASTTLRTNMESYLRTKYNHY
jgi:hypothetical protein